MWSRLGAGAALLAGMVALSAPAVAFAEDPVGLEGAYVLDRVGAVTGDEGRIETALDSLYERANIQLLVVYVDTFTNPSDATQWADEVAVNNSLGRNDLLLAVALEDRAYAFSIDQEFPLTDAQLDRVEQATEDELRNDNWADAAIAAANTLAAEAGGVVGPNAPTTDPDEPAASGSNLILPIVGGVAVVGGGVFIYSRIRKRNAEGRVTAIPDQMTQKQLDQRAGTLLVQLDDSLKTSEQELGFAVAQFGEEETKAFTATLTSARAKVAEAFTIRQKLDDSQPDSVEEKRTWTTRIIELCESADAELDAQADAFDELRQLEKNAPAALAEVRERAAIVEARTAPASAALKSLGDSYAIAAIKPVVDNVQQAQKLLAFASAAADKAQSFIAAGDASDAAMAVRNAQASLGQAGQLYDAIDLLSADLAEASEKLAAAVADTTQDIAAARALPQDSTSAPLTPLIAAAETALSSASAQGNPIASLVQVEKANAELDRVFDGVRDTQQKITSATAQLDGSITAARAQITSAMEFISTRRGGIGSTARTRLNEANNRLEQAVALAASDPVTALGEAKQASMLASTALGMARADVESFQARESYNDSFVDGSDGADLGGILGSLFGNGGSSSGGGWFGGGGSSSGSSYRPSRSSRSGSFGGSSRSSSRSSRSSGGGGRSRGGRF